MSEHKTNGDSQKYWLDNPRNVDKIVWLLGAVCLALFLADFFYHKHVHFSFENWFGFYALYGFIMCVALVLAARAMRVWLKRDEDYYDRKP
jgi:hypothetical protein